MNECQHCVRQSLIWLIVTPAWQQRPLAVTGQRDMTTSLFIKRFSLNNRISVARNIKKNKPRECCCFLSVLFERPLAEELHCAVATLERLAAERLQSVSCNSNCSSQPAQLNGSLRNSIRVGPHLLDMGQSQGCNKMLFASKKKERELVATI